MAHLSSPSSRCTRPCSSFTASTAAPVVVQWLMLALLALVPKGHCNVAIAVCMVPLYLLLEFHVLLLLFIILQYNAAAASTTYTHFCKRPMLAPTFSTATLGVVQYYILVLPGYCLLSNVAVVVFVEMCSANSDSSRYTVAAGACSMWRYDMAAPCRSQRATVLASSSAWLSTLRFPDTIKMQHSSDVHSD
eukprot:17797-Heterococcus_DN1.PRE.3